MTSRAPLAAGDAAGAFVSWLTSAALGPAVVALPVNLAAAKLADVAVRWFKRYRKTDDLSRLIKTAISTSIDVNDAEFKSLRNLLEKEQTWSLLAGDELKAKELTDQIAACLPSRDGRTAKASREAAGTIARGLLGFAILDLEPDLFQRVVLVQLHQASARDGGLSSMLKDLYDLADDRLPPGSAGPGEIKIYLNTLIDWLNTDPWPQDPRLGGPKLRPAAIERKLRVSVTRPVPEPDADADELARQCSRLVILGGPGSGKTWLAMRTARICAEQALAKLAEGAALDEVELPLYTTCSRLVSAPGSFRDATVSGALDWIGDLGGSRIIDALRRFFTERMDEPTLLIMDSLDEASDASIASERLRQASSLKPPWRVVLTSRPSSWNNQLTIEPWNYDQRVGEVRPMRSPDDVEPVIGQWFADNPERGQALAAQIAQRPDLQQAATVPLILALYCILGGEQLPGFRHKLYEQVSTGCFAPLGVPARAPHPTSMLADGRCGPGPGMGRRRITRYPASGSGKTTSQQSKLSSALPDKTRSTTSPRPVAVPTSTAMKSRAALSIGHSVNTWLPSTWPG